MTEFASLGDYNGHFVHPRLAVGGCPHPEHVPALVAAGVRAIIDCRSCMLRQHIAYVAALPATMYWTLLGTWDGIYPNETWTAKDPDRPPARTTVCPDYLAFMVERMAPIVRDLSPVLIHCGGGIGRSAHLASIAYAALEDTTIETALDRMRLHRPVISTWQPARYPGADPEALVRLARGILQAST